MNTPPRTRGRPRKFDRDKVLDRAMAAFWAKGYSGTSLDELTASMGINRPSLYSAFGSKLDLFLAVIDRYAITYGCQPVEALHNETDTRAAVLAFLETSIRCVTSKNGPRGCLVSTVAIEDAGEDEKIRNKLAAIFTETDRAITAFFQAAQEKGSLPAGADPQISARMLIAMTHSFAARARIGESRNTLFNMARDFVSALFSGSQPVSR